MVIVSPPINYLSVLIAAVVSFLLGGLWYNLLFGKTWERLNRVKMGVGKPRWALLLANFVIALIIAWTLAHTLIYAGAVTLIDGLFVTFFTWLGYFAVTTLGAFLWQGKPFRSYLIDAGFWLINLILMSIVLVVWP